MGAPNTEIESVKTSLGGNQSGTILHGDVPGSTSSAVTGSVPYSAVVVTGTPGTVCIEVKGDLQVDGTINGNITGTAAAGTLTGTTLASNVVASSLTSVGVLTAPQLHSYAKASLPTATAAGQIIYVSDATGAHVTGSLVFSNATGASNWIDVTTGVAVV